MALTIEDLLKSLKKPVYQENEDGTLPNTKETWRRIGRKDSFAELNLSSSALENFLKEWVENNPYSNI